MSSGSPVRVENVIGLQATLDYILARLGGVGGAITLTGDVTGSGVSPVATSISATGVAPGSYGDATNVAQIVVGADGRIVSATDVAISITSGINQLTGDVTAGPGTGSQAATIAAQAVTYAKIQNESDNTLLGRSAGSAGSPMEIAIGSGLSLAAGTLTASGVSVGSTFIVDGGGTVITTGTKGYIEIPFNMTITAGRLFADLTGSIQVDIYKSNYAGYPPVVGNSITGGNPLKIISAKNSEDTTLSGWTTSVSAGDILAFNVDSCSVIHTCTVSLTGIRS